jgi:TPR repeat protein
MRNILASLYGPKHIQNDAIEGDLFASYELAVYFISRRQTREIHPHAIAILKHCARRELLAAKSLLGRLQIQSGNRVEGLRWLEESANGGDASSQDMLGDIYANDTGGRTRCEKYYRMAIANGLDSSRIKLGIVNVMGFLPSGNEASYLMLLTSSVASRDPEVLRTIGLIQARNNQLDEGLRWLKYASDEGDLEAGFLWAKYCLIHRKSESIDEALEYLDQSALLGDAESSYFLGQCYFEGFYTEKDSHKSRTYFEKAMKADGEQYYDHALSYCSFLVYRDFDHIDKDINDYLTAMADKSNRGCHVAIHLAKDILALDEKVSQNHSNLRHLREDVKIRILSKSFGLVSSLPSPPKF